MPKKEGSTFEAQEVALKKLTDDPKVLALFYEGTGSPEKVAQERRREWEKMTVSSFHFESALEFADKHKVISAQERQDFILKQFRVDLEKKRPWDALKIARKHKLTTEAMVAARVCGEEILKYPGPDPGPALDVARNELRDDQDFRRRAARCGYERWLRHGNYSDVRKTVEEFRFAFSDAEADLAETLDNTKDIREKRKWAEFLAKQAS